MVYSQALPSECASGTCPSGLWGMNSINAPAVWSALGASPVGGKTFRGSVVDSGILHTHTDLAGQTLKASSITYGGGPDAQGTDDNGHGVCGPYCAPAVCTAVVCKGTGPAVLQPHPLAPHAPPFPRTGTHVAGTMAGIHSGGLSSVAGVANNVEIVACKFLTASGSGSLSDALNCLIHVVNQGAHHVQNHSWGWVSGGGGGTRGTALEPLAVHTPMRHVPNAPNLLAPLQAAFGSLRHTHTPHAPCCLMCAHPELRHRLDFNA